MDNAHREQLARILDRNRARKAGRDASSVSVGGVPLEDPSSASATPHHRAEAANQQHRPTDQHNGHSSRSVGGGGTGGASPNPQPPQSYGTRSVAEPAPPPPAQAVQSPFAPPGVTSSFDQMAQPHYQPPPTPPQHSQSQSPAVAAAAHIPPPEVGKPPMNRPPTTTPAAQHSAENFASQQSTTPYHAAENYNRQPQLGGGGHRRSGSTTSTVTLNANMDVHPRNAGGSYVQPGTEDLFRKGTFSNFRDRPLMMSPTVRSYRREPSQQRSQQQQARGANLRDGSAPRYGGGGGGVSPSPSNRPPQEAAQHQSHLAMVQREAAEHPVEKNPFRTQEYEDFSVAPRYEAPEDIQEALDHHKIMIKGSEGSVSHALQQDRDIQQNGAAAAGGGGQQPAVFDLQQCIAALSTGDWFLKWTRRKDKVHRRYFWLDVQRSLLYWGKTPDAYSYLSSSIRIEDITALESQCVVDDASGKTLYLLIIGTTSRVVQIGTEQRDKFDVWFDTLQRLSDTVREYNARYYARYAGSKMPTQQQSRAAARNQLSSAD